MVRPATAPDNKGVTILELIVAVSAFVILTAGSLLAISRAIVANQEAHLRLLGAETLQRQIEDLRLASASWASATAPGGALEDTVPCAAATPWHTIPSIPAELPSASGHYCVVETSFTVDSRIRKVDLELSYLFQGRTITLNATTYITEQGLNLR